MSKKIEKTNGGSVNVQPLVSSDDEDYDDEFYENQPLERCPKCDRD